MQAFLNELSLPQFSSEHQAKELLNSIAFLYRDAHSNGIREIKVKESFFNYEFCGGYTFNSWVYDHNTDSDLRSLVLSVLNTSPYIDQIFGLYQQENGKALEMYFEDKSCFGLGLASDLIYDTVAFSYDNGNWTSHTYPVTIKTLSVNDDGIFLEEDVKGNTRNITTKNHFDLNLSFIQEKIKDTVVNGIELWARRNDLFSNLSFCAQVQGQLENFDSTHHDFQQILNRLFELQNFSTSWDGVPIKPSDFKSKVTPESATRLKNFKDQLTIACPDGEVRLFSWHARYTPGAGRIHFIPQNDDKKLLIGSIANQNTIK